MRQSLSAKFIYAYLLFGVMSFFLVTAGGSFLVEKYLEQTASESFYSEAHNIASLEIVQSNISSSTMETVQDHLIALASVQNTTIWLINQNREIILNTSKKLSPSSSETLEGFDPTTWGNNYYQIGDFYGYFRADRLSVIAPITESMVIKGYVAIHYPMKYLYQKRSSIVLIIVLIFSIMYALSFILLMVYHFQVNLPLQQIIRGASEYAGGNLSYKIPVKSEDELGYLSNTLNYMSDKINKNGEYQREFISNVSHDFRSPLTSIKGYAEAMLDGTIPPEFQEKYLNIIHYESERLEKLTRSLVTLNELDIQKRRIHLQSFDINQTIKSTASVFEGICTERKILLELLLSGRELFVSADMEQIQQVLYNLLDNAIKFSPDNASIIIETTERNDKAFVSVKDHGCGIPKESLTKIWDRFYKIDASRGKDRKGTGLGLAIVQEIILAHDQHIDVISTQGIGTEFIFSLEKSK